MEVGANERAQLRNAVVRASRACFGFLFFSVARPPVPASHTECLMCVRVCVSVRRGIFYYHKHWDNQPIVRVRGYLYKY